MDAIPDPLLLRKCGSVGDQKRTSGCVAQNSDHWATEDVIKLAKARSEINRDLRCVRRVAFVTEDRRYWQLKGTRTNSA
jgi:uncharacterized sporulation protein YeaH/YhbH (DUF444 family)